MSHKRYNFLYLQFIAPVLQHHIHELKINYMQIYLKTKPRLKQHSLLKNIMIFVIKNVICSFLDLSNLTTVDYCKVQPLYVLEKLKSETYPPQTIRMRSEY